jgi:hypothetical protein
LASRLVTIDFRSIDYLERSIPERIDSGLRLVVDEFKKNARDNAPVDTGKLRGSIEDIRHPSPDLGMMLFAYEVVPLARSKDGKTYGTYQEFGTGWKSETWTGRPKPTGDITPRTKKFMKFEWKGETVFMNRVSGVPATHFMKKSLNEMRQHLARIFMVGFKSKAGGFTT